MTEVRYGYDPGCSCPSGSCDSTVPDVARALGLIFEKIEDPVAGPSRPRAMNAIPAYTRAGRLLTLAARQLGSRQDARLPHAIVTPCGDAFRNLSRASLSLGSRPDLREKVAEALAAEGLPLEPGSVRVRHLLDVFSEDVGTDAIRARVKAPLAGLRVAPYYGCLKRSEIAGPGGERTVPPARLEGVLSALGAEVVDFPLSDHCCGGAASEASEEVATSLHHRILRHAADRDVAVIAAVCPRCARNLASSQDAVNRRYQARFSITVRPFADLMATALGVRS